MTDKWSNGLSKCCGAEVRVGGDRTTHFWICTKCQHACDTKPDPKMTSYEKLLKETYYQFETQQRQLNFILGLVYFLVLISVFWCGFEVWDSAVGLITHLRTK